MSIIGIILLIGIVKKNAIMMIDFALNAERNEGKNTRDSIFEASMLRFRPILMTTMAALFGAVPLAVGTGMGSELRRPLGISIIGGLIVSQALTLYTTPVIYLFMDKMRLKLQGRSTRISRASPSGDAGIMRTSFAKVVRPPRSDPVLSGCTGGAEVYRPRYSRSAVVQGSSPAAYSSALPAPGSRRKPQDAVLKGKWWEMFKEPELNALEEQLNIDNQNIAQYFQNFMAARAQVREARAGYFPTVTAGPSYTRLRNGGGSAGSLDKYHELIVPGLQTLASSTADRRFLGAGLLGRIHNTVREYQYRGPGQRRRPGKRTSRGTGQSRRILFPTPRAGRAAGSLQPHHRSGPALAGTDPRAGGDRDRQPGIGGRRRKSR